MKGIKINLDVFITKNVGNYPLTFSNITNISNAEDEFVTLTLLQPASTTWVCTYTYEGGTSVNLNNSAILTLSHTSSYISFDADINDMALFNKYIELGVIELLDENITSLIVYKQNDENDVVNKKLTFVNIIQGQFNHSVSLKNVNIDILNYVLNFNYVYIPKLKRYYYVDSIELISADYTRLHLREDVLMSWEDLIKSQKVFVTRYESGDNDSLVDDRLPLEDKLSVVDANVTDTTTGSLVNCTLKFDITIADSDKPNVLIVSFSTTTNIARDTAPYDAPSGSNLPNVSTQLSTREYCNFITLNVLKDLINAYLTDDTVSSFMESVIWLPFDCTNLFDLYTTTGMMLIVKDKYIDNTGVYRNIGDTHTPMLTYQSRTGSSSQHVNGVCPYIIIKDFTYVVASPKFYDREPYANYEIYVPFVGWVKVDANKLINKRILIYYTMDLKTGISTAYIYSYTDKFVIWSGTCQIGIKIDMTTTNQLENTRQKQANDLNMILGLISSAVSIGIGATSNNPVAITGGVLSASKTIASNVNSNNQIFERATMSFGSANGGLYSNASVKVRITRHFAVASVVSSVYKHIQGLPYNAYVSNMSSLTGYVEVGEIHFDPMNENIYQDEITEIVDLLQKGVVL